MFRLGIIEKDAGKMHASTLLPTFINNCPPYWNKCDSFIIYQQYNTDQQMLCGNL